MRALCRTLPILLLGLATLAGAQEIRRNPPPTSLIVTLCPGEPPCGAGELVAYDLAAGCWRCTAAAGVGLWEQGTYSVYEDDDSVTVGSDAAAWDTDFGADGQGDLRVKDDVLVEGDRIAYSGAVFYITSATADGADASGLVLNGGGGGAGDSTRGAYLSLDGADSNGFATLRSAVTASGEVAVWAVGTTTTQVGLNARTNNDGNSSAFYVLDDATAYGFSFGSSNQEDVYFGQYVDQLVFEGTADDAFEFTLAAPNVVADRTVTLPSGAPTAGYFVTTDGSGTWSYTAPAGAAGSPVTADAGACGTYVNDIGNTVDTDANASEDQVDGWALVGGPDATNTDVNAIGLRMAIGPFVGDSCTGSTNGPGIHMIGVGGSDSRAGSVIITAPHDYNSAIAGFNARGSIELRLNKYVGQCILATNGMADTANPGDSPATFVYDTDFGVDVGAETWYGGLGRVVDSGLGLTYSAGWLFSTGNNTPATSTDNNVPVVFNNGTTPIVFEGGGQADNAFETFIRLTNPTADRAIVIPNASGTFAVSGTSPIAVSAAGDISCADCVTRTGGGAELWIDGTNGYYSNTEKVIVGPDAAIDPDLGALGAGVFKAGTIIAGDSSYLVFENTTATPTGSILMASSNGTDDGVIAISAADTTSTNRSAYISVSGNDAGGGIGGNINVYGGNVTDGAAGILLFKGFESGGGGGDLWFKIDPASDAMSFDGTTSGNLILTDGSLTVYIGPVATGVALAEAATTTRTATFPDATGTVVLNDNTATLTGKTYDTGGTGNVFKTTEEYWFEASQCMHVQGGTPASPNTLHVDDYSVNGARDIGSVAVWATSGQLFAAAPAADEHIMCSWYVPDDFDTSAAVSMSLQGWGPACGSSTQDYDFQVRLKELVIGTTDPDTAWGSNLGTGADELDVLDPGTGTYGMVDSTAWFTLTETAAVGKLIVFDVWRDYSDATNDDCNQAWVLTRVGLKYGITR